MVDEVEERASLQKAMTLGDYAWYSDKLQRLVEMRRCAGKVVSYDEAKRVESKIQYCRRRLGVQRTGNKQALGNGKIRANCLAYKVIGEAMGIILSDRSAVEIQRGVDMRLRLIGTNMNKFLVWLDEQLPPGCTLAGWAREWTIKRRVSTKKFCYVSPRESTFRQAWSLSCLRVDRLDPERVRYGQSGDVSGTSRAGDGAGVAGDEEAGDDFAEKPDTDRQDDVSVNRVGAGLTFL
jgi:hypothetical protein